MKQQETANEKIQDQAYQVPFQRDPQLVSVFPKIVIPETINDDVVRKAKEENQNQVLESLFKKKVKQRLENLTS